MSVHFPKVLRHELDSAFVESQRMSEMGRICYRGRCRNKDISFDETHRRYRIPEERPSQRVVLKGHDMEM